MLTCRTISATSQEDSERPLTFAAVCYRIRYKRAIARRDILSTGNPTQPTPNSEVTDRDTLLPLAGQLRLTRAS